MTKRVEVFDADGSMIPFESADEAHRFALRESLYGGRIEITDELGYRIVEHIRRTGDQARLNMEFVLGPFQPAELEAFEMTVVQGETIHGVDALFAMPEVRALVSPPTSRSGCGSRRSRTTGSWVPTTETPGLRWRQGRRSRTRSAPSASTSRTTWTRGNREDCPVLVGSGGRMRQLNAASDGEYDELQ